MNRILSIIIACSIVLAGFVYGAGEKPVQGIKGKVVKMSGNFMPTITDDTKPAKPDDSKKTVPLSVPVHVFKGKVQVFKKPNPGHEQFVKIVTSDKDGMYSIALNPGEYTVVAEINGELYLNSFSGGGSWTTVTVTAGKWTEMNISDSSDAVF